MRYMMLIIVLMLLITACGDNIDDTTKEAQPTATPQVDIQEMTPTPETDLNLAIPTLDPQLRPTFEMQYDELQAAQIAIEGVWSNLQVGESVSCADELPFLPSPQNYAGEHPVADLFYQAAVSLDTAYRLWTAECNNPRTQPPTDIINQGLLSALSAGDALQSAADILEGN